RDAATLEAPMLLTRARRDLDHGRTEDALAVLEGLLAQERDPVVLVLAARARIRLGVPAQDLADMIREGVQAAPFDAVVLGEAARAMADVGRTREAYDYGLSAARLAGTDPALWSAASRAALTYGDLTTAAYA